MNVTNAKTSPKVFYGLHMVEGVAEYKDTTTGEPYRIFIGENTIKNMDVSFAGKPVYVDHVDAVDLENIQAEADGYVSESFFNKSDGKHWVKFIVVSDRGHEAIRSGWRLSNAYVPTQLSGGGLWHGVEYSKEVTHGEYEHLAIVPNPRYEESVILTPEAFKDYNSKKELELTRLQNSNKNKGEGMKFNFFKRTKVENSAEFEQMLVTLPKSGREVSLTQLVNEADSQEKKNSEEDEQQNAMKSAMEDLKKENAALKSELEDLKKKNSEGSEEEKKNEEDKDQKNQDEEKQKNEEEEKKNQEDEKKEEKQNEEDKTEDKKKNSHFEALKNAPKSVIRETPSFELAEDKVARGKSRYGSK